MQSGNNQNNQGLYIQYVEPKTKQFLHIIITAHDGRVYNNDLTLSEVHLITKMVKENKSLTVSIAECSKEAYNLMFGKP